MAVSAGTLEATAARGRNSRGYEKFASFRILDEIDEKRVTLKLFVFDGP